MKIFNLLFALCITLFIGCEASFAPDLAAGDSSTTTQGSYANMLVLGDFMYIINKAELQTFSVKDPSTPEFLDKKDVGFNIESLLHYKGNLFIGSAEAMFIYTIDLEGIPHRTSVTEYNSLGDNFCMNDPLAVNDVNAYASLSSRNTDQCQRVDRNEIRVFDIQDLQNPIHLQTIPMDSPRGIALDGDILFVAEAERGLKVLDVTDPIDPILLYHFDGFKAFDLIANDGLLVVVGPDKIYEYNYSDISDMKYLSELEL